MDTIAHLKPPTPLGSEEKNQVRRAFRAVLGDLSPAHDVYIQQKIARTIRGLLKQSGGFRHRIGVVASCLLEIYIELELRPEPTLEISKSGMDNIKAALHYLCDPMDVIPDYTPGKGFTDDAFVLELCFRALKRSDAGIAALLNQRIQGRLLESH